MATAKKPAAKKTAEASIAQQAPMPAATPAKKVVQKKSVKTPAPKIAPAVQTTLNPNANWPFPTGAKP